MSKVIVWTLAGTGFFQSLAWAFSSVPPASRYLLDSLGNGFTTNCSDVAPKLFLQRCIMVTPFPAIDQNHGWMWAPVGMWAKASISRLCAAKTGEAQLVG
jgi:hypothetical protein